MPNAERIQTIYVSTGNPDTVNDTTAYAAGQLGGSYDVGTSEYQYVQLDSGATASASIAPAANQVLFIKNAATYLVTNDLRFSVGGRNTVAGILRNAATPGNFIFAMQKGDGIAVKSSAGAVNDILIANSGTAADATNITSGSAITWNPIGTITTATSGGNVNANINIPTLP